MPLELEQKWARRLIKVRLSIGLQDQFDEGLGIEKPRIRLTRFHSVPSMIGVGGDRNLFPHLAAHLEVFGDLRQIPLELVRGRRSVKGGIVAYRAKERLAVIEILAVLA